MTRKLFNVALGIVLTATTISASAQKTFTSGTITFSSDMRGQPVEVKDYFTPDSTAIVFSAGPANIKILRNANVTFMAVLVDVPVASIKKAAIYKPAEIEQEMDALPKFTFAPATDTKVINGYNCKKVVATDTKTNKTYDVWITNDVTVPASALGSYYQGIGGTPIQFTSFNKQGTSDVTVKSITGDAAPAGTFAISNDFDKISLDDLMSMNGGGN